MSEVEDLRKLLKGTDELLIDQADIAETKITVLNDILSMTRNTNVMLRTRIEDLKMQVESLQVTLKDRDEKIDKIFKLAESKIAECEALAQGDRPSANQL